MPSVFMLIHLSSRGEDGLDQLARDAELPGRGSMTKAEKIIALADEPLPDDALEIVQAASTDLIERARAADIDGYSKLSKSELQERFLKGILGDTSSRASQAARSPSRNGQSPSQRSASGGAAGASNTASSAEALPARNADERHHAIQEAAHSALDTALKEKRSYVVVESFRPKDRTQPLSIQPAYMQRHEDTQLVCEIIIPHTAHRK